MSWEVGHAFWVSLFCTIVLNLLSLISRRPGEKK